MKHIILSILLTLGATPIFAECRHALVLALDISGSVSQEEYRLQLDGLAGALNDAEVRDLLLSNPTAPVAITVFEWADPDDQRTIQDWVSIHSDTELNALIALLSSYQGERNSLQTGIGEAVQSAKNMFSRGPKCWKKTIDISGDGKNNLGPLPSEVYAKGGFDDIVVNALVISEEEDERRQASVYFQRQDLLNYFESRVIFGPGSFVELALGFSDYQRAMKLKLIKELSPTQLALGSIE